MAELPSGTVTFLLTDVEGSTALWEQAAEPMRAALTRHDELFEAVVRDHDGVHIRPRGEGDSRFAVFASAPGAAAAALAVRRIFAAERWPTPRPIRVRIGVHTGEAELRDGDYYGAVVEVARLFGAAEALRELIGKPLRRAQVATHDPAVAIVRQRLDPDSFGGAWSEGRAMNLEQARAYALAVVAPC